MVHPTESNGPCALIFRLFPSRLAGRDFCPVLVSTVRGVEIVRVLSPDLGEPFISLSRVFLLCALPPSAGLQQFALQLPFSYDVSLGNLAPFDDIWVGLRTARRVARELGVDGELEPILEWSGRKAWTDVRWDEHGRAVITQNWYARMCERPYTPFYKVEVRDEKNMTMLDPAELQTLRGEAPAPREQAFLQAWEKVTLWSSFAYEEWRDHQSSCKPAKPMSVTFEDTASLSLQTAFPALLHDATFSLEDLLSSALSLPSFPPSNGHANGSGAHSNGRVPPPKTTLKSVLALTASYARILLHLRTLTASLDVPANQSMRDWLQRLPANPPPVPSPSPSSPAPTSPAVRAELTPPSSPRSVRRSKEAKAQEMGTEKDPARESQLVAERDALALQLASMERDHAQAAARLAELKAAEEQVKRLEARLAELEGPTPKVRAQDAARVLTADEDDEEEVLVRVALAGRKKRRALSPEQDRDRDQDRGTADAGRPRSRSRSRSHSPDSDSASTIRPSSPVLGSPDEPADEAEVGGGVMQRRGLDMRRMTLAWGALVVLCLAAWMGVLGVHRLEGGTGLGLRVGEVLGVVRTGLARLRRAVRPS